MEDYYISAFIDDQLDLNEKIRFVEAVHADRAFKAEAVDFLVQELQLRAPAVDRPPQMIRQPGPTRLSWAWLKFLGSYGGGLATALLLIFLLIPSGPMSTSSVAHRFVIYQPDVQAAALVGSFTNWEAIAMQPEGASGYWEITVNLPPGEHRYSFLLDGRRQVPDPTVQIRESDDFGGINSIISVKV